MIKIISNWLTAILLLISTFGYSQSTRARDGLLDLRSHDFSQHGAATLMGEWEFYMTELIHPKDFGTTALPPKEFIDFPSTWNDQNKALQPGIGYATYRLRVLVNSPRSFGIEFPHAYSNYTLWVNDSLLARNGVVGTSEETSIPQWRPQTIVFKASQDTLDFVLHISNFYHAKGGIRENIYLGDVNELLSKETISIVSTLAMVGCLFIIAILSILIFFLSKKEYSVLLLASLCFTWSLRALFSNRYLVNNFVPDFPWEIGLKIEYITLYLMMVFAILFVASLFKNDVNTTFRNIFTIFNAIFVGITLVFKAKLYTQFLPVYLSFAALLLLYMVYVLMRAALHERQHVWLMIACLFLGIVLFSYDIISYQGFASYHPIVLNVGYLIMFLLMSTALLYQLGYLKSAKKSTNILTYEELYGDAGKSRK